MGRRGTQGLPLALRVSLSRERPAAGDEALLGGAVRDYFKVAPPPSGASCRNCSASGA